MIIELILLGSLIGSMGSDDPAATNSVANDAAPKVDGPAQSAELKSGPKRSSAALSLVPVRAQSEQANTSEISNQVLQEMAAKPQNLDEVLKGYAADCELSMDAIENLKRMAMGQDNMFSPFLSSEKLEVVAQVSGTEKKGYAYAMQRTYLGLPLVSMYSLKDEGGRITAGLITSSSLEKAYEQFLPELPTGVLKRLTIEAHPTEKNLVELICSM